MMYKRRSIDGLIVTMCPNGKRIFQHREIPRRAYLDWAAAEVGFGVCAVPGTRVMIAYRDRWFRYVMYPDHDMRGPARVKKLGEVWQ